MFGRKKIAAIMKTTLKATTNHSKVLNLFRKQPKTLYQLSMNRLLSMDKLIHVDILSVKNSLPQHLYREYLETLIETNDDFWYELMDCMGYRENDIIDWPMQNLTLEQQILLQNYPHEMPSFATEYIHIIITRYDCLQKKNVCIECARKYCTVSDIIQRCMRIQYISIFDIITFLRDSNNWCCACKKRALFCWSNDTNNDYFKMFSPTRMHDVMDFMHNKPKRSMRLITKVRKNKHNDFELI